MLWGILGFFWKLLLGQFYSIFSKFEALKYAIVPAYFLSHKKLL